jgi:ubiquinone/menaquinone biosynthesis C-methylase UbiE
VISLDTPQGDREAHNYHARVSGFTADPAELGKLAERWGNGLLARLLVRLARLERDTAVLEVGGGRGLPALSFARHSNQVVLLDYNTDELCGLSAAKAAAEHSGLALATVAGDYHFLPFADGSFDVVFAKNCLHHAENYPRVVAEAARVLAPGGRFIMIEPCRGEGIDEDRAFRHFYSMPGISRELNEHAPRLSDWLAPCAGKFRVTALRPTYFMALAEISRLERTAAGRMAFTLLDTILSRPYARWARRRGHPPGLPHPFTRKLAGGEYFEMAFVMEKL